MDSYYSVQVGYHKFFIDNRYQDLKPIGDGSYGFVASAYDRIRKIKVAIKKIKDAFVDVIDAKRILRELRLLRHFSSHDNIISIWDVMTVPPNSLVFDDIYIVTNLMESDLERIIRSRQQLTDQHFQYFLYQILRGLKYVHSANVLHRDLKPSNILVNGNCDLAVCDFGLARGFEIEGEDTLTAYVVTRWYRSPEILCSSPYYGKGCDVWSVGCIFAELLIHEPFFRGENPQHQLQVIVQKIGCPPRERLEFVQSRQALNTLLQHDHVVRHNSRPIFASLFPRGCSPAALELLQRMLEFHPDDRITVEDALNHPYLSEFQGQMPEPNCEELFEFDFEKYIHGMGESAKEAVRYLVYEEMRLFRPQSVQFPTPWQQQYGMADISGGCKSSDAHHAVAMNTVDEDCDDENFADAKSDFDVRSQSKGYFDRK